MSSRSAATKEIRPQEDSVDAELALDREAHFSGVLTLPVLEGADHLPGNVELVGEIFLGQTFSVSVCA